MNQSWLFLRRFISSPMTVGSVIPSSRFLVNAMMAGIDWRTVASIAELGAGTGVVTEVIECHRRVDSEFLCFESDKIMREALKERYGSVIVYDNASDLRTATASRGLSGLDCIVSGLPFVNFSDEYRNLLLQDIHELLNPGGIFVAFQYTRQLRPFLVSMYDEMDTAYVWANIPPAFVYICRKGR